VQVFEDFELLVAERLFLRVNLDTATLVFDVNELAFAHIPVRGDAAGQRDFAAVGVMRARLRTFFRRREFVLERVDALGSQGRELSLALFDQGISVVHRLRAQARSNTERGRLSKVLIRPSGATSDCTSIKGSERLRTSRVTDPGQHSVAAIPRGDPG